MPEPRRIVRTRLCIGPGGQLCLMPPPSPAFREAAVEALAAMFRAELDKFRLIPRQRHYIIALMPNPSRARGRAPERGPAMPKPVAPPKRPHPTPSRAPKRKRLPLGADAMVTS